MMNHKYVVFITFALMIFSEVISAENSMAAIEFEKSGLSVQSELEGLKQKLDNTKQIDKKYEILKQFSDQDNVIKKKALMEYFSSLPLSVSSTSPNSDLYKAGVFETICSMLEGKEQKLFVESALSKELNNMREVHRKARGNMYPMNLWKKLLSVIESKEAEWDMKDSLSAITEDAALPLQVRSSAMAVNMALDSNKDENDVTEMINDVLENIPLMPESAIPWEYYNDIEKRKAYYKNPVYIAERNRIKLWRRSGKEVIFKGQFAFLIIHGLESAEQIVSMLDRTDLSRERKDGLAEVAAQILGRLTGLSAQERILADRIVSKLENYVDEMEDRGAFFKRYYAIQGLRVYYENAGIKGFHFEQGGGWGQHHIRLSDSTGGGKSNKMVNTSSTALNRNLFKKKRKDVLEDKKQQMGLYILCVAIVLLCALGLVGIWILKKHK